MDYLKKKWNFTEKVESGREKFTSFYKSPSSDRIFQECPISLQDGEGVSP